jgi:hypothetical protein
MAFTQNQHVIQTLTSNASQKALADGIRFWSAIRCFQNLNLTAFRDARKALPVFAVAISNQETRPLIEGRSFSKLLCDPRIGWMSGDVEVNDSPGTQLYNEEEIGLAKEQVDNRQEITRPNVFGMVLEKNRPSLARRRVWTELT